MDFLVGKLTVSLLSSVLEKSKEFIILYFFLSTAISLDPVSSQRVVGQVQSQGREGLSNAESYLEWMCWAPCHRRYASKREVAEDPLGMQM